MAAQEQNRTFVSSGTGATKLRSVAAAHPFTQQEGLLFRLDLSVGFYIDIIILHYPVQVDLVFESCEQLESALSKLNSSFRTLEGSLTEFLRFAKSYISDVSLERCAHLRIMLLLHLYSRPSNSCLLSKILALGHSESGNEDVWCLDSRGILTLVVCKETYETLGIVGGRMPWKGCDDTHCQLSFV